MNDRTIIQLETDRGFGSVRGNESFVEVKGDQELCEPWLSDEGLSGQGGVCDEGPGDKWLCAEKARPS